MPSRKKTSLHFSDRRIVTAAAAATINEVRSVNQKRRDVFGSENEGGQLYKRVTARGGLGLDAEEFLIRGRTIVDQRQIIA